MSQTPKNKNKNKKFLKNTTRREGLQIIIIYLYWRINEKPFNCFCQYFLTATKGYLPYWQCSGSVGFNPVDPY
jgi:hypothetical protein